ncbi:hypothetical protein ABFV80_001136 [Vandammella animalimorsus]|uniref:hypothetical protein n=1 Tax=Vandammella animalimorsus TaxID=2029117 RepID=UPI00325AB9EF
MNSNVHTLLSLAASSLLIATHRKNALKNNGLLLSAFWMPTFCLTLFHHISSGSDFVKFAGLSVWLSAFPIYFSLYRMKVLKAWVPIFSIFFGLLYLFL